tara:strand:- start:2065 stop:2487 length:423 start_codon:yes stop_codon:yes gene_type:complete
MSDHIKKMIDNVHDGDVSEFKKNFEIRMVELMRSKIAQSKSETIKGIYEEENGGEEGPKTMGGDDDTIFADPAMSKEYYMTSFEHEGHEITLKKLGLGPTKPIVVHVDGKRWEVFPGPKVATKQAKSYVERMKAQKTENS